MDKWKYKKDVALYVQQKKLAEFDVIKKREEKNKMEREIKSK